MITYRGIIAYFDAICDRHQQIQSFTYGEIDLFDKDKFTKYPALHLTPTGTAIDNQTIVYGFDVVVFDRYDVSSNKMRHEANCLSDSLLILQDICKELTDGKYFINEDTNISMDVPVVCQPFIDTEPDNCSGWTTTFNVITPNESSACSIPYYNSEIWNHKTATLPSGTPSSYAWYSMLNTANIFAYSGNEVSSVAPYQDTLAGSDTLTLTGQSLTFDKIKNGLFFNDPSVNTECYLEHQGLTGSEYTFFIKIKDFSRFGADAFSQSLLTFENSAGTTDVILNISNQSGKLALQNALTSLSEFPICPTNGTNIDTAHRRMQPLTLAIKFDAAATFIECYYTNDALEQMKVTTSGFDLNGGKFYIGSKGVTRFCNFYMSEFFFTDSAMNDADILTTIEWLNYR
jgi:hypothetical protein|tara:strand:+ start:4038 stop:5243 length:1206 start_codon:yes stop_codon:yes gene_type:complete